MTRHTKWHECGRKKRYRTQGDASRGLRNLLNNGTQAGTEKAHTYYCEGCRGWHVGRMKTERYLEAHG